tara:strand:+ start:2378 stop:3166 length:789 start_codon:yes stop_codon:yes gene_type:complete
MSFGFGPISSTPISSLEDEIPPIPAPQITIPFGSPPVRSPGINYSHPDARDLRIFLPFNDAGSVNSALELHAHAHASVNGPSRSVQTTGLAYTFDGDNDYLEITAAKVGQALDGRFLSIETWINPTLSGYGWPRIVDRDSSGQFSFFLTEPTKQLGFAVNGTVDNEVSAADSIEFGVWQHVVVSYDGASFAAYVNGQLSGTAKAHVLGTINVSTDALRIGGRVDAGDDRYWEGSIGPVRIYNQALTPGQVRMLHEDFWGMAS